MVSRLPSADTVPRTVNQYLLPHEKQVITVHKHPAVLVAHCSILAVGCAAASMLTIITNSGGLILSIAWGACSIIFLWLVIRMIAWSESYFVVTKARMIFVTGFPVRKAITVPMREILDFSFHRTRPGRWLGYGTFTAEQRTNNYRMPSMNYMPYPEQLYLELRGLIFSDDSEELEPEVLL
jgi:hypothetical protein